jgi:hypothetical protein
LFIFDRLLKIMLPKKEPVKKEANYSVKKGLRNYFSSAA